MGEESGTPERLELVPLPTRGVSGRVAVGLVAGAFALLVAIGLAGQMDEGPHVPEAVVGPTASRIVPAATPVHEIERPGLGTVAITVRLTGAAGTRMTAHLYPDVGWLAGGASGEREPPVGGLVAEAVGPATLSGLVRERKPDSVGGWSEKDYLDRPVFVPPGEYTMLVWLEGRVAPVRGVCAAVLTVEAGRQTYVRVDGPELVAAAPGVAFPLVAAPACASRPRATLPSADAASNPGAAATARPPARGTWPSMAFDAQSRMIVATVWSADPNATAPSVSQTWLFDVATDTWRRGTDVPIEVRRLVYHAEKDLTLALGWSGSGPAAWAYDVETDAWWELRGRTALLDPRFPLVAVDPASGLVWAGDLTHLSALDLETGAWSSVALTGDRAGDGVQLMAYDPAVAGFVLVTGQPPQGRTTIVEPSGRVTAVDVRTPLPQFVWGDLVSGNEIAYDGATGRVAIFSEGTLIEYDARARQWLVLSSPDNEYGGVPGPLDRYGAAIVYDPVGRRIVLYGGKVAGQCHDRDDVWAFDPITGEWTLLLAQTGADLRVSDDGAQSPDPDRSPWIRAAEVTLHGEAFFTRVKGVSDEPWSDSPPAAPVSVADGLLVPECQLWTHGTVWWEETTSDPAARAWIEIELGATFLVDGAVVQADVNDEYRLSYRHPDTGAWMTLWDVPVGEAGGMATRPAQGYPALRWSISRAIVTDALRFEARTGDAQYSVSEIAVFGRPAP